MDQHSPSRHASPAPLLKAARRLLRPLVRLMIGSGVTFPLVADTLRSLFIDVATDDFLTDPKARTDSRISLLTGVHRKEVRRLRQTSAEAEQIPEVVTLVSQIVARWVGSAMFTDGEGHPLPLERAGQTRAGDAPAFDTLIGSITTDVRPRAVLDVLLAHGVVQIDSSDRVQLNTTAFIPRPGGEEQLFYFGRNLHDHVAAASANIGSTGAAPFLDRSVHYDRLTPEQAKELEDYARAAALAALLDVNRKAIQLAGAQIPEAALTQQRINFGVYIFREGGNEVAGEAL